MISGRGIRYRQWCCGAPGALAPMFQLWWEQAEDAAARERVVIDQIASMTESRLARGAGGRWGNLSEEQTKMELTGAEIAIRCLEEEGVKHILANIDYWREAPVWTAETIETATKDWFRYLAKT